MPKWNIYGVVGATKYLGQVDAENEEDAISQGWNLDACGVSVCHRCASEVSDPEVNDVIAELAD